VNLQKLVINNCQKLNAVVGLEEEMEDGQGRAIAKTLFPQLIVLELHRLPNLSKFCHFTHPIELQLRRICLSDCPAFSFGNVSAPNLSLPGISWDGNLNNAIQQEMSAIATEGAPHSQQQVPPTPLKSQKLFTGKQKILIKVAMETPKSRSKALKIVCRVPGVESAALTGPDMNHIEVIGDGIDVVALTTLLRKKVGYSELMSVDPVPMNKVGGYYPHNEVGGYYQYPHNEVGGYYPHNENAYESGSMYPYEIRDQNPTGCSIM